MEDLRGVEGRKGKKAGEERKKSGVNGLGGIDWMIGWNGRQLRMYGESQVIQNTIEREREEPTHDFQELRVEISGWEGRGKDEKEGQK
jgi:hypothetical protein